MGILGNLIGSAMGVKTINVTAEQLADLIDELFIRPATSVEYLNQVHKVIHGRTLSGQLESEDGNYLLYVGPFKSGLTKHRSVWVKNFSTNQVFEWEGFSLGKIKDAVDYRIARR